jgi:hypothetical protein
MCTEHRLECWDGHSQCGLGSRAELLAGRRRASKAVTSWCSGCMRILCFSGWVAVESGCLLSPTYWYHQGRGSTTSVSCALQLGRTVVLNCWLGGRQLIVLACFRDWVSNCGDITFCPHVIPPACTIILTKLDLCWPLCSFHPFPATAGASSNPKLLVTRTAAEMSSEQAAQNTGAPSLCEAGCGFYA